MRRVWSTVASRWSIPDYTHDLNGCSGRNTTNKDAPANSNTSNGTAAAAYSIYNYTDEFIRVKCRTLETCRDMSCSIMYCWLHVLDVLHARKSGIMLCTILSWGHTDTRVRRLLYYFSQKHQARVPRRQTATDTVVRHTPSADQLTVHCRDWVLDVIGQWRIEDRGRWSVNGRPY